MFIDQLGKYQVKDMNVYIEPLIDELFVGHSICQLIKTIMQNAQYKLSTQGSIFISNIIHIVYA